VACLLSHWRHGEGNAQVRGAPNTPCQGPSEFSAWPPEFRTVFGELPGSRILLLFRIRRRGNWMANSSLLDPSVSPNKVRNSGGQTGTQTHFSWSYSGPRIPGASSPVAEGCECVVPQLLPKLNLPVRLWFTHGGRQSRNFQNVAPLLRWLASHLRQQINHVHQGLFHHWKILQPEFPNLGSTKSSEGPQP
jgi:hypothetical protein